MPGGYEGRKQNTHVYTQTYKIQSYSFFKGWLEPDFDVQPCGAGLKPN